MPRPALEAGRVRVGDGDETVTIAEVKAWLGLGPLLRGDLYFRDLRLDDVNGVLRIDLPWTHAPAAEGGGPSAPAARPVSVDVDRIALNGGDVTLRDQSGATLLRAQGMDLVFSNEARDRFRVTGDVSLDDQPMTLDAQVGAAGSDGVRALSVSARAPAAAATFNLSGRLSLTARTLDGDVTIKADRGAPLFAALGWPGLKGTPALERPLVMSAKSSVSPEGVALTGVSLDIGGAAAKGALDWRRDRAPQLNASFDFAPITLEDWWPVPVNAGTPSSTPPATAPQTPAEPPSGGRLTGEIALRFPALSFRGQGLRDGRLNATLADGELKISDLTVTLPGTTRLNGFGLVNFADTTPALDGVVTLQTFDARGFLAWLGADVSGVPPGRLGSASFQGAVQGTLNILEVNDIEAALDTARIGGRLSFARRTRPFVGVDLRAANINLDSYRGARPAPAAVAAQSAAQTAAKPDVYGVTPSGAAFTGLGNWDAEVHVQLDDVTAGGLPGGRVGLDLGLKDGKLDIRTASFEKIAGTTAWLSGSIGGFGTSLQFSNLQFDLAGDDMDRLAALAGINAGTALKALGKASLTGTLNGGAVQADVSATLKAAGLTARATGQIMELDKTPRFNGQVEASHPRFSDLMKAMTSWPANMRDPGALAAQVRIAQETGKTVIGDAKVSIGRDRISGSAEVTEVDGRKQINVRLTDIALDLDRLIPPDQPAPAKTAPAKPGSTPTAAAPVTPVSPWSQDEIKWSFLKGWSGEVAVAGPSFAVRGVQLQDFSARVIVADNAAELADWQGKIFGAPGQLFLRLAANPEPGLQGQVAVTRADFRALVTALNGGRTSIKSSGTADIVASFSAKGTSPAAFAGSLTGSGTLKVTAAETGTGLSAGLLGPLSAAAQLDVATPGKPAPSTFFTRLSAANGAIKLENAEVASRSHTGRFAGVIDLSRRQVDLTGTLVPRKAGEDQLPISIKGAMDRPNIRLLPPPK